MAQRNCRWLLVLALAGCHPGALPPLVPVAPCSATVAPDSTWRRMPVATGATAAIPPAYVQQDSGWSRVGASLTAAVLARESDPARILPDALTCVIDIGGHTARLQTTAAYVHNGIVYGVTTSWREAPGRWAWVFGVGTGPAEQAELIAIVRSIRYD